MTPAPYKPVHQPTPTPTRAKTTSGTALGLAVLLALSIALPCSAAPDETDQPAHDSTPAPSPDTQSKLEEPAKGTTVTFTPYFWLLGADGDISIGGFDTHIDFNFIDVVDDSDRIVPLMAEIAVDFESWSIYLNTTYAGVELNNVSGTLGPLQRTADITASLGWFELGAVLPLIRPEAGHKDSSFELDTYGGLRLTYMDIERNINTSSGGVPSGAESRDDSELWLDPFIGLRARQNLSERWSLAVLGDIGGFGVGSEFSWQAMAGLRWSFKIAEHPSLLFLGYRALAQDYSSGEFTWDATVHGPAFGIGFTF